LTSCLTGLDKPVLQIKTKIVSSHTAHFKPVKQEVNSTVIPPLVFPGRKQWIRSYRDVWITCAVVLVHAVMFVHAVRAVYAVWAVHAVRALHAVRGVNIVNFYIILGPAQNLGTKTINYYLLQTSFHCHFQSIQKAILV